MHSIQTFSNPLFGDLRTIIINEKEYFFGVDIATDLMYKRPRKAVTDHCKGVLNQDGSVLTQDGEPIIPEGDVYRLIIKAGQQGNSKEIKEKADKLEKWIFDDILPTLRKTGSYGRTQLPQTTDGKIALLAQGHTELKAEVDEIKAEVKALKDDMPVFLKDTKDIQNALRKKAIEVLGGKNSNAYHDRSIHAYTFADIQIELRRQFDVKRYDQIRHKDVPDAMKIIEEYKPPLHIRDKIAMANAQQSLDLEGGVR